MSAEELLALGGRPGDRRRRARDPRLGDLRPGQPSPYSALPWLTLALIAVGIVYQYVLGRFRPDALASAPALLEGASDDTPDAGVP